MPAPGSARPRPRRTAAHAAGGRRAGDLPSAAGDSAGIGLVGGVLLILIGLQLALRPPQAGNCRRQPRQRHPLWIGVLLSGANPYFLLWWATVGVTLTGQAMQFGLLALGLFALLHWLCDLAWLEVLSLAAYKGSALGRRGQKIIAVVCAVMLLGFGLKFIADAVLGLRALAGRR